MPSNLDYNPEQQNRILSMMFIIHLAAIALLRKAKYLSNKTTSAYFAFDIFALLFHNGKTLMKFYHASKDTLEPYIHRLLEKCKDIQHPTRRLSTSEPEHTSLISLDDQSESSTPEPDCSTVNTEEEEISTLFHPLFLCIAARILFKEPSSDPSVSTTNSIQPRHRF